MNEHEALRAARLRYYLARAEFLAAIRHAEHALKRDARPMPPDDIIEWPRRQAG